MKCFAWFESAVQALTNDGKGSQRKDDPKETTPEDTHEKDVSIGESEVLPVAFPSFLPQVTEEPAEDIGVNIWNDPEPAPTPVIPAPPKRSTIRPITHENIPVRASSKASGRPSKMASSKEPLHDASLAFDYNPAVLAFVSSGRVENPRSLRRRNMSSTSTIFQNSPLAPITIIVTTPEEQSPSPPPTAIPAAEPQNPFNAIRAHRQSSSLSSSRKNSLSSPSLNIPDSNRLKPPTEQQINATKLQKAKEFREIRKFLISFMNAKGDQFPKKLRLRMMEMYSLTDADLAPETVAKFSDDIRDEGVVLEQLGISEPEGTDVDDLRILQMAFMSQIPEVTPTKEQALIDDIPAPRPRKQSLIGRRADARKEDAPPLTWLGPLLTSTPLMAPPLDSPPPKPFTGEHKVVRASSVPNLKNLQRVQEIDVDAPPMPVIPAAFASRARNSTLSEGTPVVEAKMKILNQQTRNKRGNIMKGAFGSIFGAIAASKNKKEMEKRNLMKDAIL